MQQTKRVKNPDKQRKRLFNAPAHIRHKHMAAPLSNELAASKGAKTLPVRRGDTVLIKRGDNKGFEGKVSRVDLKDYRIYLEGLTREKVDGTNIFLPIHPSKVQIRNLTLDDRWRKEILGKKKAINKPAKQKKPKVKQAKKVKKAIAKVEEVKEKKPATDPIVEDKAVTEVTKKQASAMVTAETSTPKKIIKKKSGAKKTTAKKVALSKKQKPSVAKKAVKPKAIAKKAIAEKNSEAKETAPKSRVKPKTSEKTQGGQ